MHIRLNVALIAACLPAIVAAQSFTASVRGVVTDATQSAIPAAKVTITDVDRNSHQTTVADGSGRYSFASLPPGRYTLDVEAPGFNRYSRSPFNLQVQQQATI